MHFLTPAKFPLVRSAIGFDSLPGLTPIPGWSGLGRGLRGLHGLRDLRGLRGFWLLGAGSWVSVRRGNLAIFLLSASRTVDSRSYIGSGTGFKRWLISISALSVSFTAQILVQRLNQFTFKFSLDRHWQNSIAH